GRQGTGRQYVSWLHEKDFAGAVEFLISNVEFEGVFNLSAPNPVRNQEMMRLLRKACGVTIGLPAMTFMVHAGAFLMKTEAELPLKSRNVVPGKLLKKGYKFHFEEMEKALEDLIRR
ncbi:MAG: DUF1731 domain-containing protein, partial [Lentisphaeraceae bacterium]|nr:DUF1731 domain-containing protein [Lentisphaeraceae bacterium]